MEISTEGMKEKGQVTEIGRKDLGCTQLRAEESKKAATTVLLYERNVFIYEQYILTYERAGGFPA